MPPETDNPFDAAFEKTWEVYNAHLDLLNPEMMKANCKIFFHRGARYVISQVRKIETEIFDAT